MKRIAAIILLSGLTHVYGGLLVVDHTGSGTYGSISTAAAVVAAGDTVLVKDGNYDERVSVDASGIAGSPIVFKSEHRHGAVLQGFHVTGDHITIDGFEMWPYTYEIPDYNKELDGIYAKNARYLTAVNNHIRDYPRGAGIWSGPRAYIAGNMMHRVFQGVQAAGYTTVEHNRVVDLTEYKGEVWAHFAGFSWFAGDSITFRGNYFWNDTLKGDFFRTWDGGGTSSSDILIENNFCFGAKHAAEPDAETYGRSSRWIFRNNVFVNTYYVGVYPKQITQVQVYNNTFVNCGLTGVLLDAAGEIVVRNNIFAWYEAYRLCPWSGNYARKPFEAGDAASYPGVRDNIYFCDTGEKTWFNSDKIDITLQTKVDPMLADPAYSLTDSLDTGDFRLLSGSPAIDAGADLGLMFDIDGTARPQGGGTDIGAYEYR